MTQNDHGAEGDADGLLDTIAAFDRLWVQEVRKRLLSHEGPRGVALYHALVVEERDADEVGRIYGMSRDAVYQWLARLKRRAIRSFAPQAQQRDHGEGEVPRGYVDDLLEAMASFDRLASVVSQEVDADHESATESCIEGELQDIDRHREALARQILPLVVHAAESELRAYSGRYDRGAADLRNDVAHDVMIKLFADGGRVLRAWDPQRRLGLPGFVRRVVRFHVVQLFRSSCGGDASPEPSSTVEAQAMLDQLWRWLWEVRDRLLSAEGTLGKALYRSLIVEKRDASEVGQAFNLGPEAVSAWLDDFRSRALQSACRREVEVA